MPFDIRAATLRDIPALETLIERSVRGLQRNDYTAAEIDLALATVYGVDSQLIRDGTYFVVEARDDTAAQEGVIVACGGWSKRRTLFGGDHYSDRPAAELDPTHEAAKIRAFFVDPNWARRGIGSLLLDACERAAFTAGFTRLEMGATLTGVPFYRARGYVERDHITVPLSAGEALAIVRMEKERSSLPEPRVRGDIPQ